VELSRQAVARPEEITELIAAERAFRRDHGLEDERTWGDYCAGVGKEWLRSLEAERGKRRSGLHDRINGPVMVVPVPLEERGPHMLTPIEAPFYDALAETGLTFSVQPWIEHAGRKYRLDFLVYYDGRGVAVELDGHDSHKTKEQRGRDAARDRWLLSRGIPVVRFTGSQVWADVAGCVKELLDVLRQSQARP
jgi:very-short-patch-repair endonuclease